jgi:alginate O-acetyltransferase complex protein AlgI
LTWQAFGIPAEPLMRMPIAARSLGEFWSLRWNRGFNDLAHRHVFQPTQRRIGVMGATLLTFLASGLVHDLVISVPARAGYGLPTLYFLIQGIGVLVERSRIGRWAGLRRGMRGRLFALAVVAAPAYWLFHPAFVGRVIIPFLKVMKAI